MTWCNHKHKNDTTDMTIMQDIGSAIMTIMAMESPLFATAIMTNKDLAACLRILSMLGMYWKERQVQTVKLDQIANG